MERALVPMHEPEMPEPAPLDADFVPDAAIAPDVALASVPMEPARPEPRLAAVQAGMGNGAAARRFRAEQVEPPARPRTAEGLAVEPVLEPEGAATTEAPAKPKAEGTKGKGEDEAQGAEAPKTAAPKRADVPEAAGAAGATAGGEQREAAAEAGMAQIATGEPEAILDGLGGVPPSLAPEALASARSASDEGFQREHDDLAANPPSLERPSGLPRKGEAKPEPEAPAKAIPKPKEVPVPAGAPAAFDTQHQVTRAPLPVSQAVEAHVDNAPEEGDEAARAGREALASVPTGDESIDTSAGTAPRVELVGEANPGQLQEAAANKRDAADKQWATARADMGKDYGENDVWPDVPRETLRGKVPKSRGGAERAAGPAPLMANDQARAALDHGAGPTWADELAKAKADNQKARDEREAEEAREHAEAKDDIAALEQQAATQQTAARKQGKAAVAEGKKTWSGELAQADGRYTDEQNRVLREGNKQIADAKKTGDADAKKELLKGEKDALDEKRKAQAQAAAEKAKTKKSSGGFFGWVKRKVKAAISAIRKAVNFIIDKARQAVKWVIEKAKQLAKWVIEKVRKLVVGLIRAFGKLLELAADTFLAFFPEARDRAKAWIRKGVQSAEDAVNKAADWLKDGVDAVLDALGAALDFVLELYQKAWNLVLSVVEFLVVGLIEIIEGLVRLGESAMTVPDHFWGQVSEEGLGVDLTQPLPMEKPAEAAAEAPTAAETHANAGLMEKQTLEAEDIEVDRVGTPDDLEPEALQEIADLAPGEYDVGDGESDTDDPAKSAPALKATAAAVTSGATESTDDATAAAGGAPATTDSDKQIDQLIQNSEQPHVCDMPKTEEPAKAGDLPAEQRIWGPFTPGQRLRFFWAQIKNGISQWWSCNWPKIITYVALGVLGFVALLILSGGAILALIPPLLEIVALIMLGAAVVKATGYIKDWVTKGWDGDIQGGGKSLTRGLVILLIELIFALLFNIGAVIKSLKGGLKAAAKDLATLAKTTAKNAVKNVGKAGKAAVETVGAVLKNGKLAVKGIGKGFGRGAKSLGDLMKKVGAHLKFRKFKIKVSAGWFELLGEINPWIVILKGPTKKHKLEWVDPDKFIAGTKGLQVGSVGTVRRGGKNLDAVVVSGLKSAGEIPGSYRKIFDAWADALHFVGHKEAKNIPQSASDYVIHHVIEQQAFRDFAKALKGLFKNSPMNFRAIAKGAVNEVVHLSGIRRLWDAMYPELMTLGPAAVRSGLLRYAKFTERFIDELVEIAAKLEKRGFKGDALKEELAKEAEKFIAAHAKKALKASLN